MNFKFFFHFEFLAFLILVLPETSNVRGCSFRNVICINCPGFQICEEGFYEVSDCDEGIRCTNDEMVQCWMKLKRGKDNECTEVGIFPVSNTYNEYYVCSRDSFGFLKQKFFCPKGFFFDQTKLTCMPKSNFLYSPYNSDRDLFQLESKFSVTQMTTTTAGPSTTPTTTTPEPSTTPTTTTPEPSTTPTTTTPEPSTTPTTTTPEPSTTPTTTTPEPSTTPTTTTPEPSTTPTTTTPEPSTTPTTTTPEPSTTPTTITTETFTTLSTPNAPTTLITTTKASTITTTPASTTTLTVTTTPTIMTTPPTTITTSTTETTTPTPLTCLTAGIFPHPSNCKMYYRCSTSLKIFYFICPGPSYFNHIKLKCSMEITALCREQISKNSTLVKNIFSDENEIQEIKAPVLYMTGPKSKNLLRPTTSSPTTKTPLEPFICKQRGRFLHPTDCRAYYRCSLTLKPYVYFCPKGNYFNEFTKECNPTMTARCQELNQL